MVATTEESLESLTLRFLECIKQGDTDGADRMARETHPARVADVLEALPKAFRHALWRAIQDPRLKGELLIQARPQVRNRLITITDASDLAEAVAGLELDEVADIYAQLPRTVVKALLKVMDHHRRERFRRVVSFPHDTAGGLMDADALAVREDVSLATAQRYLRWVRIRNGRLPEHVSMLMVVDRLGRYRGVAHLADVMARDQSLRVRDVMQREHVTFDALDAATDVARAFEHHDLVTAPVLGKDKVLLGRITVDDVVDVIRAEGDSSALRHAGLGRHEDLFAPWTDSARRRGVWLGVNLLHALGASLVIGAFERSIESLVALAVLMPVVASMGGVAGLQTLTLVTRGLATGQVGRPIRCVCCSRSSGWVCSTACSGRCWLRCWPGFGLATASWRWCLVSHWWRISSMPRSWGSAYPC